MRGNALVALAGSIVLLSCGDPGPPIDVLSFSNYAGPCEVVTDVQRWDKDGVTRAYMRKGRDSVKRELVLGVDTSLAVRLVVAAGIELRGTRVHAMTVIARFGTDGKITAVTEMSMYGDTLARNVRQRSRPASPETVARVEELTRLSARQCVR